MNHHIISTTSPGSLAVHDVIRYNLSLCAMSTPKEDGFRAPAEWEPHSACLIGWPRSKTIWQKPAKAQRAFLEVIRAICKSEKVIVITNPG